MLGSFLESFLSLVRLGIGHHSSFPQGSIDWPCVQALAQKQALSAVVLDGIEKLPEDQRPSPATLLTWISGVLSSYEQRYELYCRTIAKMAAFYGSHDIKLMVLKGFSCSLDWPKPNHRPCGDIDIWLFGNYKKADSLVKKEGIKVDNSHHHHTVFYWDGFMVENHYDFVNVHAHRSSKELEVIFKQLGQDDSHFVELDGTKVYLPSPNLHALFLLRHMVSHFASSEINLRQVLDWAFFIEKHTKEVDWGWLCKMLERFHMKEFFECINGICVEDLGFDTSIFPKVRFNPSLKEKVLNDILEPAYGVAEPKGLLPRLSYKYRRWQANAWKQKMCYGESRWSYFWSGVWAKLLKPSSI